MNQYIQELHKKPLHHKKRFALLAAGFVTLVIFAFWSAITFSNTTKVAENSDGSVNLATPAVAVTPFQDILHGIETSWTGLMNITANLSGNGK